MSEQAAAQVAAYPLTDAERTEALATIQELFGIDTTVDTDPLIDMPMIAKLAGVAEGTPGAWQQRTRIGKERIPFPAPDDRRYHDKPQWRAISTIIPFLKESDRWPRGAVARVGTRRERPHTRKATTPADKVSLTGLRKTRAELAQEIERLQLDDGEARTVAAWQKRRWRAARSTAGAA